MKRFIIVVIALLMAVASVFARTYALTTAVSNYQRDGLSTLSQSTKDAKAMASLLHAKVQDVSLVTGKNATAEHIKALLMKMAKAAGPNDQIIFFYSGHGGKNVICLYDKNITYYEILGILTQSKCKNILVIVDACESGSLLNAVNQLKSKKLWNGNVASIVSSRAQENSIENPIVGAGFLAQGILKGMRGKADANSDRKLTIKELYNYAFNDVTTRASRIDRGQHPQLIAPAAMQSNVIWTW